MSRRLVIAFLLGVALLSPAPVSAGLLHRFHCTAVRLFAPDSRRTPAKLVGVVPPLLRERIWSLRGAFNPNSLRASWGETTITAGYGPQPAVEREGQLRLTYQGRKVAEFDYYLRGGALRFDIEIVPRFRGTKLYEYLLAQALARCPSTTTIPARMWYDNSDNARFAIDKIFGSDGGLKALAAKYLTPPEGRELRRKIYDIMYLMPAIKARERNGFGRLSKVIFNPDPPSVAFVVEKGPRGPPEETKIFFDDEEPRELNTAGQFVALSYRQSLRLGNYVEWPH